MAVMKKYEQGALIKTLDHNLTQRKGVIFSKPEYSVVSQASVYNLKDFKMEQEIFEGLKLKLLIDTDSMGDSFSIKINDSNYLVFGKFEAGNVYNLLCVKTVNDLGEESFSFIIEKSGGGGISTTTNLWTGQQPFLDSGDFMDLTFENILSGVNSGLLKISTSSGQNLKVDILIPAVYLETSFYTQIPIYQGQSSMPFYLKVFKEGNNLRLTNDNYTVYPQNAFFTSIDLIQ